MNKKSSVSIIIPCHNEEKTVIECIESFINQTYPDIEIIIVDDCSEDNTYELAKRYEHEKKVRVVRNNPNRGEGFSRNEGIRIASGEIILETECDGKYLSDYVEKMVFPLSDKSIGGVLSGRRYVWSDKQNLIVKYWDKKFDAAHKLMRQGKRPINGAWAFRKEVLEEVGLYDETLRCGTDVDLVNRIKQRGYNISFVPDANIYHKDPDTIRKLIRRIWWGSIKCKRYREKWNSEPKGIDRLFLIGRNVAALLLPAYLVLAFIHSTIWLTLFFGVLFAESIFPIIYNQELRLTFELALKDKTDKYYTLALAMPFICWLEIRTRSLGIFYAMLRSGE